VIASFFPDQVFGWTFILGLLGFLAAACCTDTLRMKVPKAITLTALAVGLLFNLVRGVWLGAAGEEVWALGADGGFVGALDGFLFALTGLLVGFGLMFLMWLLGTCGGGDVKLFAAVGVWLGPKFALYVFMVTVPLVILFALFLWVRRVLKGEKAPRVDRKKGKPTAENWQPKSRLVAYSVPVTLATLFVLLWVFRVELGMAPPRANNLEGQAHAAKK
jgi:prepilin peptidase CpaA